MKVKKLKIKSVREDLMQQEDPISLRQITPILVSAMSKIRSIDDAGYVVTLGIYGATAKETRTKKSPIDIYVFLNSNAISKPVINKERAIHSLYGIPADYWEPIRAIIVDEFGINPFTQKPYVINVVSAYEIKNKKDNVYNDMLVLRKNRLVNYRDSFGESEYYSISNNSLIEGSTVLDFPSVRQSNEYSCGASVVTTVLAYYGIDKNEKDVKTELKTNSETGTTPKNIIKYFRDLDFKVDAGIMSIDMIIDYINRKIPVVVLIQAWAENKEDYDENLDNGHYVVVIGYTENKLFFEDPSIYHRGQLSFDEFKVRWKDMSLDDSRIYRNYGIAVYGKDAVYSNSIFQTIE